MRAFANILALRVNEESPVAFGLDLAVKLHVGVNPQKIVPKVGHVNVLDRARNLKARKLSFFDAA